MKNNTLVFLGNNRSAGNMVNETFRYRLWTEGNGDQQFHLAGIYKSTYADLVTAEANRTHWILSGHLTYGVHRLLERDVDYFMNIREAGNRLVSKFQQWGGSANPEEFIKGDFDLDNSVTKRLAGYYQDEDDPTYVKNLVTGHRVGRTDEFKVTQEIFDEAIENAKHVPFTIMRDRLPESLVLLEKLYGIPPIFCFRFFNNNRSVRRADVSPDFMAQVRELNHFDNILFDQYDAALSARLDAADAPIKMEIEARRLAMDAITRIDDAFDQNTEVKSIEAVFNRANELFARGDIDLGLEVLFLIIVNPGVSQAFREKLVAQIAPLPNSYSKEKVQSVMASPITLSSRWT